MGTALLAQSTDLFSGPSVLSRGPRPIGFGSGRPVKLTFFAGTGVTYATGLMSAATDEKGNLRNDSSIGGYLNIGMYGVRSLRRGSVGFNYQANWQIFTEQTYYTGVNQSMSVNYTRQLNRRSSFALGVGAGQSHTTLDGMRGSFATSYFDTPIDPASEIFDSPNYFVSAFGSINYQVSARWTVAATASTFAVRRHSAVLVNSNGWAAGGQAMYALSRRSSVGVGIHTGSFYFQRAFGEAQYTGYMMQYSRVLSSRWSIGGGAGVNQIHAKRLTAVRVDPVIAALLGRGTTIAAGESNNSGFAGSATLFGAVPKGQVSVSYLRGVLPGNGLYLTSTGESAHASYVYTGIRRVSAYATGSIGRIKDELQASNNLPQNKYESASVGMSIRIFSAVSFTSQASVGRFDISKYASRNRAFISAGLAFSSGQLPLLQW